MRKFGIEISPGIVNALNWSTNSSTSIILTDINSIDLFQNNKLGNRVRSVNQDSLSLFLQWYFVGFFTFSPGKIKWKLHLLFTFLRLEVSWVRQLEEAVLGNYSQLPGAIPMTGYSICRSTGSWNSCGLTTAGEVCDPHSSWETSGTCPTVSRSQVRRGAHQTEQLSASAAQTPKCSCWWPLFFIDKCFETDPGTGAFEGTGISLQTSALILTGIWVASAEKMQGLMSLELIFCIQKNLRWFLLTGCSYDIYSLLAIPLPDFQL